MKKWILKAILQKSFSYIPYGFKLNYLMQKYVTKGLEITNELFKDRFKHAQNHLNYYIKYHQTVPNITLELGTGWLPIVPIYFYLVGVNQIHTIDINLHLKLKNFKKLLKFFIDYFINEDIRKKHLIQNDRYDFIQSLINNHYMDLYEILSELNINYQIIDARKLNYDNNYFDLIHSNNTFEHIYPTIFESILVELNNKLKFKGVMSHFIDMSDHFSHIDSTITIYNFLKFSDLSWKIIDNNIQPQNRLRKPDYLSIYEKNKIKILELYEESIFKEDLMKISLNQKYKEYNLNDLAVSYLYIVSSK